MEMIDGVISEGLDDGELAVLTIAEAQTDRFIGSWWCSTSPLKPPRSASGCNRMLAARARPVQSSPLLPSSLARAV